MTFCFFLQRSPHHFREDRTQFRSRISGTVTDSTGQHNTHDYRINHCRNCLRTNITLCTITLSISSRTRMYNFFNQLYPNSVNIYRWYTYTFCWYIDIHWLEYRRHNHYHAFFYSYD